MEAIEKQISDSMLNQNNEKTFIDKILAKDDVNSLRVLIKKPELTREDMLDILYLLSGSESKLWNYGNYDRHVMAKYFVWIREFIMVAELIFDYEDDSDPEFFDDNTKRLFKDTKRTMSHIVKFLVEIYLNLARTTLSLGATGVLELLKNKFEVDYMTHNSISQIERNQSLLGKGRGY